MLVPGFDHEQLTARTERTRVYRAHQRSFDRDVVITVIEQIPADEAGRRRFTERWAAMGRLTGHPGILTVIDSGFTDEGHPYLITPHCPDGSLADQLAAEGPLPVDEVVRVAIVCADALAVAHRAGLLHLDITPDHVLRTPFGPPALGHLGLPAAGNGGPADLTAAMTVDHLAPEVLDGAEPTAAADAYALGSTLWTLLTGQPPHPDRGGGLAERIRRVREDPVPPLERSDVPDELESVLRALLATSPGARPEVGSLGTRLARIAPSPSSSPATAAAITLAATTTTAAGSTTGAATTAPTVAGDLELGPPAPPAPWQGRLTSWDDLADQPVSFDAAAVPATAVAGTTTVPWADAAPATGSAAGPAGSAGPAGPPGPPDLHEIHDPLAAPAARRRRWPVVLATVVVMLVAAGATLAVLSRSRADEETLRSVEPPPSTGTTVAPATAAPTTAAPAPTTAAPGPTTAPPTAPPTTAAPGRTTVPAGTGQVVVPAGTDAGTTAAAATIQQAATALADGRWAVARNLIPDLADTGDDKLDEGWGNLEHATVVVTDTRTTRDRSTEVRIGVVALERDPDGTPRTNLYCATWVVQGGLVTDMKDDQVVGGQPWRAGSWSAPGPGVELLQRSCRPLR